MIPTKPLIQVLMNKTVTIQNEWDVSSLKRLVNEQADTIKMGLLRKTMLATATSELVRNMLRYAGGGQVLIQIIRLNGVAGIKITFTDQGPGIPDIAVVMENGYSTGNTLGLGLPGTQRLCDEFSISSQVNEGTTVIITKWAND